MYHTSGRDDDLFIRYNRAYKKRKKELGGGFYNLSGEWQKTFKKLDFHDEVVLAGLDAQYPKREKS
jgi:hypothetical protein